MKKPITLDQPDKIGVVKSATVSFNSGPARKLIRDHRVGDCSHGRVTKHAIGINHEPGIF